MKVDIFGFDLTALERLAIGVGERPFRGRQIAGWLYKKNVGSFMEMTNLATPLRYKLADKFSIGKLKVIKTIKDKAGVRKMLWRLSDGETVESVLIPDDDRLTLCVSSQVGCPLNCTFCATGRIGFKRNLSSGEIINQFLQMELEEGERITNIVFMGMGEPFLNFDNLNIALRILTDDSCISFGAKKITVSTAGIPNKIRALADTGLKVGLAFSLNAPNDELRNKLMPINRRFNLRENLEALKYFTEKADRRITFEYVLIKGINDSLKEARQLVKLTHNIPCKINLIRYNKVDGIDFSPPKERDVLSFRDFLYSRTPAVTLRESKGSNISAACGQLKATYNKKGLSGSKV